MCTLCSPLIELRLVRKSRYARPFHTAGLYAFYLVTDLRLVPAVNILCTRFSIPDDVAGATALGAALNSPELFTNIVGLFVTKSDVGLGLLLGACLGRWVDLGGTRA